MTISTRLIYLKSVDTHRQIAPLPQRRRQIAGGLSERGQLVFGHLEPVRRLGVWGGGGAPPPPLRREILGAGLAPAGVEQLGQMDVRAEPLGPFGEPLRPVG